MMSTANKSEVIAIVGCAGLPAQYGGFETLAENIVVGSRHRYAVYCESSAYAEQPGDLHGTKLHYIKLRANGIQSIPYDVVSMIHGLVTGYRRFLLLGVSGAVFLPFLKLIFRNSVVATNIDGIEWRRDKWGGFAKWFLRLSERLAVRWSDVVIADNGAIAEYVQQQYGRECRTIAYGGDHALRVTAGDVEDFALSVCRIEPENNIHVILEAFSRVDVPLKMVGNWQTHDYGRDLKQRFSGFANLELIDPVYDLDWLASIRSRCAFYVHGHSAGGTNPSLVEIMHFGKPVLAFDCEYNRATMHGEGRYFTTADDLAKLVRGQSVWVEDSMMIEIANACYTWSEIRDQYDRIFD